ncbi:unnamed protein product [Rotaria sordida]|uniref:EF-hand domain-containing protein n=1 Tax=Rotaria sordida TaxID=392033 RepID=A0A819IME3_9BILA|nr:unnamed protein product [Rotaria sordida]CAF3620369.1 unnamed protein product [Rotaria sordida]CAF3920307.1 unnamed protein product [Rotaria sordida]
MEALDLAIDEEILLRRTSRTATFTLSSSSSSSSSCSNLYNHQNGQTSKTTITSMRTSSSNSYMSKKRLLIHSQSLILDNQRHRPTIHDPFQLSSNLQILNNWMITTTGKSRRELGEVHGFSEEQIAVFEESFSLLDKNGDGNISNYEIRSLMNSLGYSPSEEDISTVISKVDTDGNGSVDFDEFLTMMRCRRSTGESDTELYQVFKVFDKNRDGFIDKDELYDMLSRLGEHLTEEDIKEMIAEADCLDHDGKVSYEEFKAILYSK